MAHPPIICVINLSLYTHRRVAALPDGLDGDDYETRLSRLSREKLADLKAMCQDLGLPVSGKKEDLAKRIAEAVGEPEEEAAAGTGSLTCSSTVC